MRTANALRIRELAVALDTIPCSIRFQSFLPTTPSPCNTRSLMRCQPCVADLNRANQRCESSPAYAWIHRELHAAPAPKSGDVRPIGSTRGRWHVKGAQSGAFRPMRGLRFELVRPDDLGAWARSIRSRRASKSPATRYNLPEARVRARETDLTNTLSIATISISSAPSLIARRRVRSCRTRLERSISKISVSSPSSRLNS